MIFKLENKEFENYKNFIEQHKNCKFTSTIGGKFTISFTPTGLGNIIKIKCTSCNTEIDITDINNW